MLSRVVCVGLLHVAFLGSRALAEWPVATCDVAFNIECKDVTPPEYKAKFEDRKIIEAVFPITFQLKSGNEDDINYVHYSINTNEQAMVADYLPKSQLFTEILGPIEVDIISAKGTAAVGYSIRSTEGQIQGEAALGRSNVSYRLLPPKSLILASGTTDRSTGVYFKLKSTKQDTLQNQKQCSLLFEVPTEWRGDYVNVKCEVNGNDKGTLFTDKGTFVEQMFCVGLYASGDTKAK